MATGTILSTDNYQFSPSDGNGYYWGSTSDSRKYSSTTFKSGVTFTLRAGLLFSWNSSSSQYTYRPALYLTWDKGENWTIKYSIGSTSTGSIVTTVAGGAGEAVRQTSTPSTLQPKSSTSTYTNSISATATVTNGTSSFTLSCTFRYSFGGLWRTWTFNANGGYNAPAAQSGWRGQSLTLPGAITRSGVCTDEVTITFDFNDDMTPSYSIKSGIQAPWVFKNWNTKSDGTGTGYSASSTQTYGANNLTLYAAWGPRSGAWSGSQVQLPSVSFRTGYIFKGWYSGGTREGGSGELSQDTFTSNATIQARWEAQMYPYTVYYKGPDGSDLLPPATGTAAYDSKVTKTAPTYSTSAPNNKLYGYAPNKSSISITINEIENIITFQYNYKANTLAYNLGTYGTWDGVSPAPLTKYNVASGTVNPSNGSYYIVLPSPNIKKAYENYSFIGWTGGGVNTPKITTPTVGPSIRIRNAAGTGGSISKWDGTGDTYTAHYERVSRYVKGEADLWIPVKTTYVKVGDVWKELPKYNSKSDKPGEMGVWTKINSTTWKHEAVA